MPVPTGPGPHTTTTDVGPWRVDLQAHQGKVRTRIEDAWATVEGARLGAHTVDVFAVFDGLGGVPNGQQAAWAAADGLADAIERADDVQGVLHHLNEKVRATGGATTAVLLIVARGKDGPSRGWMLTIGDSSIYKGTGDALERLNPLDRRERHVLSDWLGRAGIGGHLKELAVTDSDRYVLCTDGADEVAGADPVAAAASTDDVPTALDRLFDKILDAGAPDNATVMVVRPGQSL